MTNALAYSTSFGHDLISKTFGRIFLPFLAESAKVLPDLCHLDGNYAKNSFYKIGAGANVKKLLRDLSYAFS
jgi:hypothetical protein